MTPASGAGLGSRRLVGVAHGFRGSCPPVWPTFAAMDFGPWVFSVSPPRRRGLDRYVFAPTHELICFHVGRSIYQYPLVQISPRMEIPKADAVGMSQSICKYLEKLRPMNAERALDIVVWGYEWLSPEVDCNELLVIDAGTNVHCGLMINPLRSFSWDEIALIMTPF